MKWPSSRGSRTCPDHVAFYPWMTVRATLDYFAAFRKHWNRDTERDLLSQFGLDVRQKTSHLSKGQRTQLALITAICPEPELLVLDEPTSGLDPIVRREFIQTVIGAYQEGDPGRRTVFVSTHLISEFEGLIDEFTIIERGRNVLTLEADAARARYQKIFARFATEPTNLISPAFECFSRRGREIELLVNGNAADVLDRLKASSPESIDDRVADARRDFRERAPACGNCGMTRGVVLQIRQRDARAASRVDGMRVSPRSGRTRWRLSLLPAGAARVRSGVDCSRGTLRRARVLQSHPCAVAFVPARSPPPVPAEARRAVGSVAGAGRSRLGGADEPADVPCWVSDTRDKRQAA